MKKTRKWALASLLLANSAMAVTPQEGWYAGLMGGVSFVPGIDLAPLSIFEQQRLNNQIFRIFTQVNLIEQLFNPFSFLFNQPVFPQFATSTAVSIKHNVGGDFGGQVGYRICNFRFEGQLLFNYAPLSELNLGGIVIKRRSHRINQYLRASGETMLFAGLFNAYYDFYDEEDDPTWVPYLGLGIGYSYIRSSVRVSFHQPTFNFFVPFTFNNFFNQSVFDLDFTNSKSAPVGQGIIGISYYSSDNLSLGLDYRYLASNKISGLNSRINVHAVNVNFNYWFNDV